ncbi:MAG: hypothetical protein ABFD46_01940 [Armatimonadota bacterium]
MRGNRGVGLIDVMITAMLLGMAGIIFAATFPSGLSMLRQTQETKKAVELAQKKLEQIKALGYESLSYGNLRAANAIDEDQAASPYIFTQVDNLDSAIPSSVGKLDISNYSESGISGVKKISVTINWRSGTINRSITLQTIIADKRPWGV